MRSAVQRHVHPLLLARSRCAAFALLSMLVTQSASGRTWNIRADGTGDAPTIQAGIDSAAAGDDVLLAAGTYTWTSQGMPAQVVVRLKPGVWLHSQGGSEVTIIDGERRRGILCEDVGTQVRVEGLTIQNCARGLLSSGDSNPTIVGCVFQDNAELAPVTGGGITCGSATIQNCTFLRNLSGVGGALYCGPARVENCAFIENGASDGGHGGAIAAFGAARISNCRFEKNGVVSGLAGLGGAISGIGPVWIESCLFLDNLALGPGSYGGAVVFYDLGGVVRNSTFIGNQVLGPGPNLGAAVAAWHGALVENCTILAGRAPNAGGIGGIWMDGGGTVRNVILGWTLEGSACGGSPGPQWICCNLFANAEGDAICGTDGGGNFSADPQFCSGEPLLDRNVGLQADSPCAPENHPDGDACGLIGARPVACGTVSVERSTWGEVKSLYR